mgnify:CR=1 FL=1
MNKENKTALILKGIREGDQIGGPYELAKILSESLTSKEAQRQLTSPWVLFKNLVF